MAERGCYPLHGRDRIVFAMSAREDIIRRRPERGSYSLVWREDRVVLERRCLWDRRCTVSTDIILCGSVHGATNSAYITSRFRGLNLASRPRRRQINWTRRAGRFPRLKSSCSLMCSVGETSFRINSCSGGRRFKGSVSRPEILKRASGTEKK